MKKTIVLFFLSIVMSAQLALAQISTPAPSPLATVSQVVGLTKVEVVYSRPAMRGRTIMGELVPYGQLWRTGANQATKISFDEPMSIAGTTLPAGSYAIFSIPEQGRWTVIFNKNTQQGGTAQYKQEEDALRIEVTPMDAGMGFEDFTVLFSDLSATSANLNLLWENTRVSFPITDPDVDEKVMTQIQTEIPKAGDNDNVYFAAASYYFANNKDMKQAAEWVDKAVSLNEEKYWVLHLQAKIHAALNNNEKAATAARKSMELAKKNNNPDYVKLNEALIATLD
ncbi:MAG: DUF2911 domain-containing protein [Cyclobacteriaceae bacterium]